MQMMKHWRLGACILIGALLGSRSSIAIAQATQGNGGDQAKVIAKIELKVYAKGSAKPLGRVEVRGGGKTQFTDATGRLELDLPAKGTLEFYRRGYEPLTMAVEDLRGKANADVFLYPAAPSDDEIIVKGSKRPEASRKTISVQEAVKVAPGGDPAQVPKLLPGVQSRAFSPDIIVRGSGPFDSRYYIDHWEVPYIFHRIGSISILPDQILSDVEFTSGGFGAQYGGATGGVVNLRTKTEIPEQAKTEFRVNLPIYSSVYHERPMNDGKDLLAVSARRSYIELILPMVLSKAGNGLTVTPYFGDDHLYYVHPTADGYVKGLGLWSDDGIKALFPSDLATGDDGRGDFSYRNTVGAFGLEWKQAVMNDWSLTLAPEVENTTTRFDVVGNHFDLRLNAAMLKAELSKRIDTKDKVYLGSDLGYGLAQVKVLAPKFDYNDPFFDFEEAPKVATTVKKAYSDAALWTAYEKNLGDLLLIPGIRAFYSTVIERGNFDPRLNMRYKLSEQHALKGAAGQYSQVPQFQDADATFGNPHLKYIRSYHYVLGVDSNWDQRWTTDLQVFYKETKDLVRTDPVTNTNNNGSMISSGFEAFIRRNLTERLFGWLSYTYSRTRERDTDLQTYQPSQYDQSHVLNLAGNYHLTSVWNTGGRFVYHTGDTFTGVDDAVYNTNLDKYQARQSVGARKYGQRLPPYHELDVFGERDWLYDTWKLTLRFGVEYLALQQQAQGVQYNYDYSSKTYFRGLPPIPYLELRGVL